MVGAAIAQQVMRRIGVRMVGVLGMGVAAFGLFLLSGASVGGSYTSDLLPGLIPMSIGMGMTFVPVTLIATTNVAPEDAGLASGLFNTAQQIGGALGLAVLATLASDRTSGVLGGLGRRPTGADVASASVEGFQVAFLAGAILVAVGAALLWVLVRQRDVANVNPEAVPAPA